jgi:hypothetical protein
MNAPKPTRNDLKSSAPAADGRTLIVRRGRRMRRSARALVVWGLALYLVSLAAWTVGLKSWRPTVNSAGVQKLERLQRLVARAPDRPLLVMLGSSRTDGLFAARRFDGLPGPGGKPFVAYNFGVPMAGAMHEWLYLRQMLAAGLRPRLLLVEFLPPLLIRNQPDRISVEEGWTSVRWRSLGEMRALRPYLVRPGEKSQSWLEARLAPWYDYRYFMHGSLIEAFADRRSASWDDFSDPWGYQLPRYPAAAERAYRQEVAHKEHYQNLHTFQLVPGAIQALRDLLECCRREQIPVVLVLTPESTTFRSWYAPPAAAEIRTLLGELCDAYGVGVIDAREWLADNDLLDGHHVLASGAQTFTTRLLHELQPLLAHLAQPGQAAPSNESPSTSVEHPLP